jgi:hypothetical protein
MVDLHPVTEEQVEVGGRRIGVVEDRDFVSVGLPNVEARLTEAIEAGLYVLEAETEFDFLQHYDEVEELLEAKKHALAAQQGLVRRIRAVTPPLLLREHAVLRRFRAVPGTGSASPV